MGKENKRIPELATRDWQLSARANIHPRETREEIRRVGERQHIRKCTDRRRQKKKKEKEDCQGRRRKKTKIVKEGEGKGKRLPQNKKKKKKTAKEG